MTDPRRRPARLTTTSVSTPDTLDSLLHDGESGTPAPEAPVQIRPVRRPAGQVPTTSIEALSGVEPPAPRAEVQVRAYRDPSRRASTAAEEPVAPTRTSRSARARPTPAETVPSAPVQAPVAEARPEPKPRPPTKAAAPVPAASPAEETEAAPASAPRSGWLSSALNDWLKEPEAPAAPRREAAPARQVQERSTATQTQVIQAAPKPTPEPAPPPQPDSDPSLPRTLQEALASNRLPDLPVELLERLWEQEQAAQDEQEQQPQPAPRAPVRPAAATLSPAPSPAAAPPALPRMPEPALPLSPMPEGAHAAIPTLQPMFPGVSPFLARFLPLSAPLQLGLSSRFCDLHAFLKYLHELSWYGYLHVSMGDLSTYALVYEGRVVAAAAVNATGEQALGELLSLYEQGATMATYPLPPTYAHVLSGVGSRAWKFDLTEDFTGLYVHPDGALFYSRGEVVAAMPAGLPYEGAFPAPLRPQTLILPRSFAGWAHRIYIPTLRGRDANNPITSVYHGFREQYGAAGAQLIRALGEGQTPAEYAVRADVALHDLEPLLQELTRGGYLKEHGD